MLFADQFDERPVLEGFTQGGHGGRLRLGCRSSRCSFHSPPDSRDVRGAHIARRAQIALNVGKRYRQV